MAKMSVLFLFVLALAAARPAGAADAADAKQWVLMVDAGSSGSRMRIFSFTKVEGGNSKLEQYVPAEGADEDKLEVEPGVSTQTPAKAAESILGLVTEAKRWVPEAKQAATPIYVKATAGMRLLKHADATAIWTAIRAALADKTKSPFAFKAEQAGTLSGAQEGAFGLLSVNYIQSQAAAGGNRGRRAASVSWNSGALDMGGASTQLSFEAADVLQNDFHLAVDGQTVRGYGVSYLHFGADQFDLQIFREIAKASNGDPDGTQAKPYPNPCQGKGMDEESEGKHYTGTGDWSACVDNVITKLLDLDARCFQPPCALGGEYQPALDTTQPFFAFSAFFYAANGLGLLGWGDAKAIPPATVATKGAEYCADQANFSADKVADNKFLKGYCPRGAYAHTLLTKGYGFAADTNKITFARKLEGQNVDWVTGAVLHYDQLLTIDGVLQGDRDLTNKKCPTCCAAGQSRAKDGDECKKVKECKFLGDTADDDDVSEGASAGAVASSLAVAVTAVFASLY